MSVSQESLRRDRLDWVGLHIMFGLGLFTLASLFSLNLYLISHESSEGVPLREIWLPTPVRAVMALGVIAMFWLWVRMLVDFFRRRPERHPVAWGWAVTLGVYLGGLAYFWFIWRAREKRKPQASDA